jgi:uncharacterized protein with FMN-binding domain
VRRITIAIMSTISALVLLLSYRNSIDQPAASTSQVSGTSSGSTVSSSASGTYTGSTVQTQWGPIQVEITVVNGKIADAHAVLYPTGNSRNRQINAYAVPLLNQEVVQQQSANIDAISGATVTSDGYIQSLQSAIDQANQ